MAGGLENRRRGMEFQHFRESRRESAEGEAQHELE